MRDRLGFPPEAFRGAESSRVPTIRRSIDHGRPREHPESRPGAESTRRDAQTDFPLDYSHCSDAYANFCRISRTPDEMVFDFGLNPEFSAHPSSPIKITHRLILNFYTAKRLLLALNHFIKEHEATFGNLEIDYNKRTRPSPGLGQAPRQG